MELMVTMASLGQLNDCEEALMHSELGRRYFAKEKSGRNTLKEGILKQQIYVGVDENDRCIGFIWLIKNGMFHSFPYLHMIAIKEEERNKGIGKKLLEIAEKIAFYDASRLFLLVGDFNPDAKRLYKRVGYETVCEIPNLYREGITEQLMMKCR